VSTFEHCQKKQFPYKLCLRGKLIFCLSIMTNVLNGYI
jgi:hypothetical protein